MSFSVGLVLNPNIFLQQPKLVLKNNLQQREQPILNV